MLSVNDCITFQWKSVSLPIHREEELTYALYHVSYYDSPFSSSYDERKAYYGEDWHSYTGEELVTLCTLPGTFLPEQKDALVKKYRSMIDYGNTTLDRLESFQIPLGSIICHFINSTLEEAESYLKLYGYTRELLKFHHCSEEQKKLIYYCYRVRTKERETTTNVTFLQNLKDTYGSDILSLAIQQYKIEECLHQLKSQVDKYSSLKDHL
jgi:hypothetical protein